MGKYAAFGYRLLFWLSPQRSLPVTGCGAHSGLSPFQHQSQDRSKQHDDGQSPKTIAEITSALIYVANEKWPKVASQISNGVDQTSHRSRHLSRKGFRWDCPKRTKWRECSHARQTYKHEGEQLGARARQDAGEEEKPS